MTNRPNASATRMCDRSSSSAKCVSRLRRNLRRGVESLKFAKQLKHLKIPRAFYVSRNLPQHSAWTPSILHSKPSLQLALPPTVTKRLSVCRTDLDFWLQICCKFDPDFWSNFKHNFCKKHFDEDCFLKLFPKLRGSIPALGGKGENSDKH